MFKHFPVVSLAYILSDFKLATIDCLGHNKFNWEVNNFIFHAFFHYCPVSLSQNAPVMHTVLTLGRENSQAHRRCPGDSRCSCLWLLTRHVLQTPLSAHEG